MIITQFTNLQIIWTPGENLPFPDQLSRHVSLKDLNDHQVAEKENHKDIRVFNQSGKVVQNLIDHNSSADDGNDNFYPICANIWVKQKHFTLEMMVLK